jgi:DNA topoisomerase I
LTKGPQQPAESARAAGLRYVSVADPGIRRRRAGEGFRYLRPDGRAVTDAATLARIRKLAIPPAWTEVWICAAPDGHVQATGHDARGRKQYRYHPRWREVRDETKYGRMVAFGRVLPRIRRRVARDLARPGLPREKVLATVVRLLEKTFIRVGNEEYARENESFGLTTLRERQVKVNGSQLRFRFRGKSGVQHEVEVSDPHIAAIVRRMQDLPGEELFQYVGDDGAARVVDSSDVNAYLKEVAGEDFTSKDFRTWAGTLLCARLLCRLDAPPTESAGKREVARVVEAVSRELRNTRAVCRKCYIHPAVIDGYLAGRLVDAMQGRSGEAALISLLRSAQRRDRVAARRSGADGRSLTPLLRRSIHRLRHAAGMRVAAHG